MNIGQLRNRLGLRMRLLRFLLLEDDSTPRDGVRDERWIWLASALVGTMLFLVVPITYLGGSDSYLRFARVVSGQLADDAETYFRTPGYPLLLIVTGVLRLDTFRWLTVAQMALAIAIPVLVYRIVSGYSRQAAFYTAMLSVVSLVPYGYAKVILTEEAYLFGVLLTLYFAGRVVVSKNTPAVYGTAIASLGLSLFRPVAAYLFLPAVVIMIALVGRTARRLIPHLILSLLFVALGAWLTTGWKNAALRNPRMAVSAWNSTDGTGKQLFYNVYLTGGHLNNEVMKVGASLDHAPPFINDGTGPAARKLRQVLQATLTPAYVARTTAGGLSFVKEYYYGRFAADPKRLVDEMLNAPSMAYYFYMWRVLDDALGPQESDHLLLQLSLELLRGRPIIGIAFVARNIYFFASGVSLDYIYSLHPNYNLKITQPNLSGLVGFTPVPPNDVLTPNLSAELHARPGGMWNTRLRMVFFYHLWTPFYLMFRPLLFVGLLAGPVLLRKTSYGPVATMGAVVVLYHMFVVCVFCMPIDRYVTETLLVELTIAAPAWVEGTRRLVRLADVMRGTP